MQRETHIPAGRRRRKWFHGAGLAQHSDSGGTNQQWNIVAAG
ncbi:hypothetical protein [Microbispora catharanthi]|nr:hypothetical protein [Microbispora catharanthi]